MIGQLTCLPLPHWLEQNLLANCLSNGEKRIKMIFIDGMVNEDNYCDKEIFCIIFLE